MILMVKKLLEHSIKKNYIKQIKKNLEHKKYLKKREISYMPNGNTIIIHLIAGLRKKILYKISQYFLNRINLLEQTLTLKLIYLIMQQKLIKKET